MLASGTSERQVRSTAQIVVDEFKEASLRPLGVEGRDSSHWVLVDYADVIFHIFLQDMRSYYDLDGLWADAPRIDPGIETGKLKEVEPT